MMTKNILIVGVGGQGTLLASKVMGKVFLDSGYDVKVSEVHGMSQRGGSVVTYVRYGDEVYSTLIDKGEADILLSFEALEAARWLPYLKKDGVVITNTQRSGKRKKRQRRTSRYRGKAYRAGQAAVAGRGEKHRAAQNR